VEYFVPSHIIDRVARNNIYAKNTSIFSHTSREKRSKKTEEVVNNIFVNSIYSGTPKTPKVIVYDSENTWIQRNKPAGKNDAVANKVREYIEFALEYLQNTYNRNGIDNKGSDVHVNIRFGEKYMNAFWDGTQLTLGEGDGVVFSSFSKSLDVITHEIAHGLVQYICGLVYKNQSGALNEHLADVFGTVVQQAYLKQNAESADWLIGNEVMGTAMYGESLRSMAFPGTAFDNDILGKDSQPSHMKDLWTSPEDNGGVHINSGIPNRIFYLTAMDIGTDYTGSLWYKAMHHLWPTATFKDMKAVTIGTARGMVEDGSLPQGSTQILRAAFKEVGL